MDLSKPQKVLIISSGQPSLNPRLVKEADALAEKGYDVLVIYAYWNEWGTQLDEQLLPTKKWNTIRAGGDPKQNPGRYFISRLINRIAITLVKKYRQMEFAERAISRASYFLEMEAKKHRADLYIAHNLGALPAAVKAAKKFNKPCGFDAEDFHRYEATNDVNDRDVILKTYIENKYLPQTNYLTASSPQIAAAYEQLFAGKTPLTLLNVFCKSDQPEISSVNPNAPLKLFWFSQTIGYSRGLEDVIEALGILKEYSFELHLLGDLPEDAFKNYLLQQQSANNLKIFIYPPISSIAINAFAATFDIGLALEPAFSVNNDLALSNKLFTYLQAGLALIASDTTAQLAFINQYPAIGNWYGKGDGDSLAEVLIYYYKNREALLQARRAALQLAHSTLNWETERVKFLTLVKQTIQQFN
jgi:glycosyltransferase involved in cell wall biosynthesis